MTLVSMTGFAERSMSLDATEATVRCRSVNHRGLDIRVTVPNALLANEPKIVALVRAACHRGRVEVRVDLRANNEAGFAESAQLNAVLDDAVPTIRALQHRHGLLDQLSIQDLIALGLFRSSSDVEPPASHHVAILDLVRDTLTEMNAQRAAEGARLNGFFDDTLELLATCIDTIEAQDATAAQQRTVRLQQRLAPLLAVGSNDERNARVAQEIALILERADITEEIVRARSHMVALQEIIAEQGATGKKIDFMLQELIRETNTMASKSADAALTRHVVDAKALVEQLREQASNIE